MDKIAIRADGSTNVGMGHIMRCVAISKELQKRNIKPIFFTKNSETTNDVLQKNKIDFVTLKSSDLDDEIQEVETLLAQKKIDCILTDSYWLSNEYLNRLDKACKLLISIDDNKLYDYPSDIIINSNIYASDFKYPKKNENVKLLLGCKYSILREEFVNVPTININKDVRNILVTMGGTDVNNFTPIVLNSISDLDVNIHVIIGPGFRCTKDIIEISNKYKNINLIYNPSNMKDIMIKNDIVISASGTTTYELGTLGIPTILIGQADNQNNILKKVKELGIMLSLGNFKYVTKKEIREATLKLINDYDLRLKMNKESARAIYSSGVKEIVDEIMNSLKEVNNDENRKL